MKKLASKHLDSIEEFLDIEYVPEQIRDRLVRVCRLRYRQAIFCTTAAGKAESARDKIRDLTENIKTRKAFVYEKCLTLKREGDKALTEKAIEANQRADEEVLKMSDDLKELQDLVTKHSQEEALFAARVDALKGFERTLGRLHDALLAEYSATPDS